MNRRKADSLPKLHHGRCWAAPKQLKKLTLCPPLSKNQNYSWLVNLFTWIHSPSPRHVDCLFPFYPMCPLVPRIHVKIALNVVNAWNLVQMKLLSCRSRIDMGTFRKFLLFVRMPIWLFKHRYYTEGENPKTLFACIEKIVIDSWKELIKLIKKDLGTTMIGSFVAEIFNLNDTSKRLSQHFRTNFD